MDPLSIATGCATLISTIGSLSLSINSFIRTCRDARGDLDRVARELLSLQIVLELIQEDVADESKTFPTTLQRHVSSIVTNCNSVVVELQECITKYGGDSRLKSKAVGDRPSDSAYLSDWELDSAASDPASCNLKKKRCEEQKREERFSEAKLKDVQPPFESPLPKTRQEMAFHHSGLREDFEEDDELVLPPDDAILEGFERSSVESETEFWERKMKELQAREDQLPEVQRLGQSTSSREDTQRTAETHHLDRARVPEKQKSQDSPTEISQAALKQQFKPDPYDIDDKYSHDYEKGEPEVKKSASAEALKTDILSETPDFYYLEVKTFHGRLRINWPMPTAVTDLFSEESYYESSCNTFTALTCSAQEFSSQKDTLRPKWFLKPRDIKVVFYIPVKTWTTSDIFNRQWEFITTAIVGLTRCLELGGDVPPPWHSIVIVIEGPPRWNGINPEIEIILTELGILY
ncbi:hypothetical protein FGADI_1918 [Fusarium gaditjirri]|uniref:chitin synthase n=1 Tax=Fusarium gaditjirri TaxID=282569 RepID=A0A8H4TJG4_9HYPO|nr:hypothetical protein FGADI_1918 [Fusarium gaditjirri]